MRGHGYEPRALERRSEGCNCVCIVYMDKRFFLLQKKRKNERAKENKTEESKHTKQLLFKYFINI